MRTEWDAYRVAGGIERLGRGDETGETRSEMANGVGGGGGILTP